MNTYGLDMLAGIILLWTVLTIGSLIYVIYDLIAVTPNPNLMKVAWVLLVLYTGPIGLFFYLVTCREHLPGTHQEFTKPLWKQALGSEVHCLAGDATGIIAAAIILSLWKTNPVIDVAIEYIAGFGFGLFIFQALFMKSMFGGYTQSIKSTFLSELLSMNMIMSGMIPVMVIWAKFDPYSLLPYSLHFWFRMSMASIVGGMLAYPMNYFLVKIGIKHGMMTKGVKMEHHSMDANTQSFRGQLQMKGVKKAHRISWIALVIGIAVAFLGSI